MRRVDANDSDMSGSTFINVNLASAVFDDVNLTGTTLNNVNLSGLRISHANLKGASIVQSLTDGMTINGISVIELLACYQANYPVKPDAA